LIDKWIIENGEHFRRKNMNVSESDVTVIDKEWFALILEAKELGLSVETIKSFLKQDEVKGY
ncbi:anti-repressor SinI family protein, partial [Neobacillus drentensis]|uniref:anti-repressor SinI family protein n=1 Tax=Neobacillus drentensis TaxID=220684 RepID=UPI003000A26E